MSLLHVHFALRNQQAFQRALDGGRGQSAAGAPAPPGTSAGKSSWSRSSTLGAVMAGDVNARDWLGRTVLHLACASVEPSAIEYVRLMLAHPAISVNLQDLESHWTALHRALYHGNIAAALLLIHRNDTDLSLKDLEGYTAFDLYNSTLEDTKPSPIDHAGADLFTWGANRNATLGIGSADDRVYPEQIVLKRTQDEQPRDAPLDARFCSTRFRQVVMSKLHTGVVTTESGANVRLCGFGSGGRLGPGQHTQYNLSPLAQLQQPVIALALGQDHTLALTRTGEVFSWGLNRFTQLGYAVEAPTVASGGGAPASASKTEEQIQAVPKRILGPLRKEVVLGVAVCKTASACWTDRELFTWGTNSGQLGYDRAAQPVQTLPRIVTKIVLPVIGAAISDTTLACLLHTKEVVCLWNDRHIRINFPMQTWPSEITPYRPPQANVITKVTACDGAFAALSSHGEVFTFSSPSPATADAAAAAAAKGPLIKPQRVWALRKKFSAVRDVALGADGALVICTESGHVYVRSRAAKGGTAMLGAGIPVAGGQKTFQFQRVPFLQRVVAVCANSTGAFGALHVEYRPPPIDVQGRAIAEDIAEIQPYMRLPPEDGQEVQLALAKRVATSPLGGITVAPDVQEADMDEEGDDAPVSKDIATLRRLCELLRRDLEKRAQPEGCGLFEGLKLAYGADLMVHVGPTFAFPAHRVLAAARNAVLEGVLAGMRSVKEGHTSIQLKKSASIGPARLLFAGFQPMSILVLFVYLYSDELPALWDRRVMLALEPQLIALGVRPAQVKVELAALARLLELPLLGAAAEPHVKRAPALSLARDLRHLHTRSHAGGMPGHSPLEPDVVLQLADRRVYCHSLTLRARSPFFAAFFNDEDWTIARWTPERTVVVDLTHLRWRSMEFVLRFLCYGEDREMFDSLEFVNSVDELLDFMFEVKAAANELLIDRLILLCSEVILRYVNIHNAGSLLGDASYLHSFSLVGSLQSYMAVNMETLLEGRLLEELTPDLVKQLSKFVRQKQAEKAPITRQNKLVEKAMLNFGDWLALQDIPAPIVPSQRVGPLRDSPKMSPPTPFKKGRKPLGHGSPVVRPQIAPHPIAATPSNDDIFIMDEVVPSLTLEPTASSRPLDISPKPVGTWKSVSATPKADMKSIMAEAQSSKTPPARLPPPSPAAAGPTPKTPQREWRKVSLASPEVARPGVAMQRSTSGGSPWRLPAGAPAMTPVDIASSPPKDVLGTPHGHGGISRMKSTSNMATGQLSSTSPRSAPTQQGLGPVISPMRQPSFPKAEASSSRRAPSAGGKAWTLPPVQPIPKPTPAAAALSFADIQAIQFEQGLPPENDKRSLREIQEEEQARQVESDFMKWWQEEEARLRFEAEVFNPGAAQGAGSKRSKKSRGPKSKADSPAKAVAPVPGPGELPKERPSTSSKPVKDGQGFRGGARGGAKAAGPNPHLGEPSRPASQPREEQLSPHRGQSGGRGTRGGQRGGRGGHAQGSAPTPQPLAQAT